MRIPSMNQPAPRQRSICHVRDGQEFADVLRGGLHSLARTVKAASVNEVRNLAPGRDLITHVDLIGRGAAIIATRPGLTMADVRREFLLPLEDYFRRRLPLQPRCWFTVSLHETVTEGRANPEQEKFGAALRDMDAAQMTATINALLEHRAALDDAIEVACEMRLQLRQSAKVHA